MIVAFLLALSAGIVAMYPKIDHWYRVKSGKIADYKYAEKLNLELNSKRYLLYRMSDNRVLYADGNDEKMFPASLTKLMTLDAVLRSGADLSDVSSFSGAQRNELIAENASLAYLSADRDYTLKDLLYGLILPSGADAAVAIENYFVQNDRDILELFAEISTELELNGSSFLNTTGLHDDDHYTTLDDLLKIVRDVLKYEDGFEVLSSKSYLTDDETVLNSSLARLDGVLGGKTGYTGEAGENLMTLFEMDGSVYILLLGNAEGNPYRGENYHFDDCYAIMEYLRGE